MISIKRGNKSFYEGTVDKRTDTVYICLDTSEMFVGKELLFHPGLFRYSGYESGDLIFITHEEVGYRIKMSKFNDEESLKYLKTAISSLLNKVEEKVNKKSKLNIKTQ